jgi:putative nucleotidyltransferase with HDIG domain
MDDVIALEGILSAVVPLPPSSTERRRHAIMIALERALAACDDYTAQHSRETSALAGRVAARLGVGDEEVEVIAQVAVLHDLGKLGIPREVLNKPGPLTADEQAVMREHPVIGERILRAFPEMSRVATAVRHEHERWDGGGYPDGLSGEAIPLPSRIVLACDAWHAMTSDRPYRRAMSSADATRELRDGAGSQFDPDVTEALLEELGAADGGVAVAA